jgi:hypothetical protein
MTRRLIKELRPLLFPLCVAAITVAVSSEPSSSLSGLAPFGFCAGCVLLAALTFGSEFQQRTMPLLLSQPVKRSRLWKEKLLVLTFAVTLVGLIYGLSERITGNSSVEKTLLAGMFLIATVCSTCYWTFVARSTIGGMAFSLVAMFLSVVGVNSVVETTFGPMLVPFSPFPLHAFTYVVAMIVAGSIYSALFLWLGWRKFANLELIDISPGEGMFELDALLILA